MSFIDRTTDFQTSDVSLEAHDLPVQRRLQKYVATPIDMPVGMIEILLLVVTAGVAEVLLGSLAIGLL